jgi:hypothetical protein
LIFLLCTDWEGEDWVDTIDEMEAAEKMQVAVMLYCASFNFYQLRAHGL